MEKVKGGQMTKGNQIGNQIRRAEKKTKERDTFGISESNIGSLDGLSKQKMVQKLEELNKQPRGKREVR